MCQTIWLDFSISFLSGMRFLNEFFVILWKLINTVNLTVELDCYTRALLQKNDKKCNSPGPGGLREY